MERQMKNSPNSFFSIPCENRLYINGYFHLWREQELSQRSPTMVPLSAIAPTDISCGPSSTLESGWDQVGLLPSRGTDWPCRLKGILLARVSSWNVEEVLLELCICLLPKILWLAPPPVAASLWLCLVPRVRIPKVPTSSKRMATCGLSVSIHFFKIKGQWPHSQFINCHNYPSSVITY